MYIETASLLLDSTSSQESHLSNNLHLFQFNDIKNPKEILELIKLPNSNFPNCTILDCSRIISLFQIQLACTKAYLNQAQDRLKTRSIYTEILLSLSHSTSISESFKNFGISSKTRDIFIIVDAEASTLSELNARFDEFIKGIRQDIPTFNADLNKIAKVFPAK